MAVIAISFYCDMMRLNVVYVLMSLFTYSHASAILHELAGRNLVPTQFPSSQLPTPTPTPTLTQNLDTPELFIAVSESHSSNPDEPSVVMVPRSNIYSLHSSSSSS